MGKLPNSMDDLVKGITPPGSIKTIYILRREAARDLLSSSGEWKLVRANDRAFIDFQAAVAKYNGGALPQQQIIYKSFTPPLATVTGLVDLKKEEEAPGGEDNEPNGTGPFIGVVSRSRRKSDLRCARAPLTSRRAPTLTHTLSFARATPSVARALTSVSRSGHPQPTHSPRYRPRPSPPATHDDFARCAPRNARKFFAARKIKVLTSLRDVFISPICCAPFSIDHKLRISTASCGHNQLRLKKEQHDLWLQRKLAVPKRVARRRVAAAAAAARKRAAPKRAVRRSAKG
jgi:hypothetical protein